MRSRIDHIEPVTYALPPYKINNCKTTNHTPIDKGKAAKTNRQLMGSDDEMVLNGYMEADLKGKFQGVY